MEQTRRNGKTICVDFEEEYQKYCKEEESKIFREIPGGREDPTLYSVLDTTGGMFSCTALGEVPKPSWREW